MLKLKEAMRAHQERTGQRVTYEKVAEMTGLARSTIEALGSRKSYNTTLGTVDKICRALGCCITDLIEYQPIDDG